MTEGFFIAVTAVIIIYCGICIMMESISRWKKQYAAFCSGILIIWSIVQGVVDMVKDSLGEQRELLQPFARYYLK